MGEQPPTETCNELTDEIDRLTFVELLRVLRQTDSQIFCGWRGYSSVFDDVIFQEMSALSSVICEIIESISTGTGSYFGKIVMSGCGTSGRIAFQVCRSFNLLMESKGLPTIFEYLISGGDKSLIMSQELPEDDPNAGVMDLKKIEEGNKGKMMILIGITCGISAPYVLGQIQYAMENPLYTTALIGFNPVSMARDMPVENWDSTCRQVASKLLSFSQSNEKKKRHFVINPVIGPEPVTGSTRMKGGSTTKIILEGIFSSSLASYENHASDPSPFLQQFLLGCERAVRMTYISMLRGSGKEQMGKMVQLVSLAASALRSGSHIYYVGDGAAGILGFIDASEMFDTYGEDMFSVRGFVNGGWDTLRNSEGHLSGSDLFCLSSEDFDKSFPFGNHPEQDIVIFPFLVGRTKLMEESARRIPKGVKKIAICVSDSTAVYHSDLFDLSMNIQLGTPNEDGFSDFYSELSLKLVLNAITTGACIQKGRVYGNQMINLGVSNNKLFYRSIGIIQKLMGVEKEAARRALLSAVYEITDIPKDILDAPISSHIIKATPMEFVLPTALLLASGEFKTVSSAKEALAKEPLICKLLPSR